MNKLVIASMVVCSLAFGCSRENSAYCDESTPCQDEVYSYCDLTGALGAMNGCVKPPVDASSPPDGAPPDAADLCAGVDCSALDSECTRGACDPSTGQCTAEPLEEGAACGAELECGDYSECEFPPGVCPTQGSMTRTCRQYTCQAGVCAAGAPYTESATCARETDGLSCGTTEIGGPCSECGGFSEENICDETGTQSCPCTRQVCAAGSCTVVNSTCSQSCTRQMDGFPCGLVNGKQRCCAPQGICTAPCIDP
ncbi:MAG TPA: hypothetical protein VKZ63_15965 [Kofleriaceae bacterium]|nr:hypothetical protein [Kofleriaceae bacterium]